MEYTQQFDVDIWLQQHDCECGCGSPTILVMPFSMALAVCRTMAPKLSRRDTGGHIMPLPVQGRLLLRLFLEPISLAMVLSCPLSTDG